MKVVCAVIVEDGKVFATARGYGKYRGMWEFAGGKIEANETPQEALVREIKEELDVDINVGKLIRTVEYDYTDFHLSMYCYLATIKHRTIRLVEAQESRWLGIDELNSVNWLPADRMILEDVKEELWHTQQYHF